jgi:hypothetical protein
LNAFLQFCGVKIFDFAFRLGVLFAVFSFIWGMIRIGLSLIRNSIAEKSVVEEYSLKTLQYFFLVDVTFLFCLKSNASFEVLIQEFFLSFLLLTLYFIGKLQNKQKRTLMFSSIGSSVGNTLNRFKPAFNLYAEISVLSFGLVMFIVFYFYPQLSQNPISNWFYSNVVSIENSFFLGFIFKIIGFFVILGIFNRLVNGIAFLLSGKPFLTSKISGSKKDEATTFDDFEEL